MDQGGFESLMRRLYLNLGEYLMGDCVELSRVEKPRKATMIEVDIEEQKRRESILEEMSQLIEEECGYDLPEEYEPKELSDYEKIAIYSVECGLVLPEVFKLTDCWASDNHIFLSFGYLTFIYTRGKRGITLMAEDCFELFDAPTPKEAILQWKQYTGDC